jgi:hypothetical protein
MRTPPSPADRKAYPLDGKALSNDRQVIDLHWLHCRRLQAFDTPGFHGMLDPNKPFDWIQASRFVQKVGGTRKKAELLGLIEFDQLQLAAIQTKAVSDRWQTVDNGLKTNRGRMLEQANAPSSRLPDNVKLMMPDIYRALRIAKGSPSKAANAYRWLTGHEIAEREISKRQQWLKKHGVLVEAD